MTLKMKMKKSPVQMIYYLPMADNFLVPTYPGNYAVGINFRSHLAHLNL